MDQTKIKVSQTSSRVRVTVGQPKPIAVPTIGEVMVADYVPPYSGEYEVTPKVDEEVILPTKDKRMMDDVTVHEVPIFYTGNETGTTVYIGTEVK